jgi:hypothetical protein
MNAERLRELEEIAAKLLATQSRKGLQDRQMNRSGRRTIFAMLLIVALVIIWTVMGGRSLARA